jgi:hypothetical protein
MDVVVAVAENCGCVVCGVRGVAVAVAVAVLAVDRDRGCGLLIADLPTC